MEPARNLPPNPPESSIRPAPQIHPANPTASGIRKWWPIGVAVAVMAAFGFLVYQTNDLSSQVNALKHTGEQAKIAQQHTQIAQQQARIRALTGQITGLQGQLAKTNASLTAMSDLTKPNSLASQLHTVLNCVPQLESQVNGLTIADGNTLSPWIRDDTQISNDCSSFIYGTSPTP